MAEIDPAILRRSGLAAEQCNPERRRQQPMLNVFHRDRDAIRHFWGSELFYASADPGQDPRHVGTIEPLWNLFDLTPAGRGTDWYEQRNYV
jgi:predicted dithiol-disulfide oxidoreductase (DUF899 family)